MVEVGGGIAEGFEGGEGEVGEAFGFFFGFLEAEDGGVGGLVDGLILASCFAEGGGVGGDVEDVVDDLEGEAEVVAEGCECLQLFVAGVGSHGAEPDGGGEEGGGFALVNGDQLFVGEKVVFAFAFEVENLSADELFGTSTDRKFGEVGADGKALGGWGVGDKVKGFGLEGITGENGDGFAKDFVRGGATTAEVVVVHGGEVVVDERVGVEELGGAGGEEGVGLAAATSFGGGEGEDGAQSFTTCEDGIAHGLVDFGRLFEVGGKVAIEVGVDENPLLGEVAFEVFARHDSKRVGSVALRIKTGLC